MQINIFGYDVLLSTIHRNRYTIQHTENICLDGNQAEILAQGQLEIEERDSARKQC